MLIWYTRPVIYPHLPSSLASIFIINYWAIKSRQEPGLFNKNQWIANNWGTTQRRQDYCLPSYWRQQKEKRAESSESTLNAREYFVGADFKLEITEGNWEVFTSVLKSDCFFQVQISLSYS